MRRLRDFGDSVSLCTPNCDNDTRTFLTSKNGYAPMKLNVLPMLLLAALVFFQGCSKDDETPAPTDPTAGPMTCLECHSSEATLKKVAAPNPPPPPSEGGCGGTLPEMEAWQKVYIGGPNGQKFLASTHGKMKCVACHGGVEPAADKNAAHAGGFIAAPSKDAQNACGNCHPAIASKDLTSLHTQGFGQKHMVALRGGFPDYASFPEMLKTGYDKNCGKCHASCGECHVMRPRQALGGFIAAHDFKRTPDMRENCTACHSARVANAYFGEAFGTRPDVHYSKFPGGHCINCHKGQEMHGDGKVYNQRYKMADMPQCEDCHAEKATANPYHSKHWNDISCYTCHSQEYQNCGSCHVGTGVRNGPYFAFKIGRNAMPQTKRFKYVVVRNAPFAPDTWSNYGIPLIANFDAAPTFKLASPHNIQRWTDRTKIESGKPCFDACHIQNGRNKNWFLFEADLKSWEVMANKPVVVDGTLPAGWN